MILGQALNQKVIETRGKRKLYIIPNIEVFQSESSNRIVSLEYDDLIGEE